MTHPEGLTFTATERVNLDALLSLAFEGYTVQAGGGIQKKYT